MQLYCIFSDRGRWNHPGGRDFENKVSYPEKLMPSGAIEETCMTSSTNSPDFLQSDHVSGRTRAILTSRLAVLRGPEHLSERAFSILRVVCDDLLPHHTIPGTEQVDLAALVDWALGSRRDGWRYADLPSDREAYEAGLLTLDDLAADRSQQGYAGLAPEERGHVLDSVTEDGMGLEREGRLTAAQMTLWMADLRADVVTAYLSHPSVQQALGISAVMTGGDGVFQGFSQVGPDQKEPFEPAGMVEEVRS